MAARAVGDPEGKDKSCIKSGLTSTGCMQTGKSGEIISKSPIVWKVRESQGI